MFDFVLKNKSIKIKITNKSEHRRSKNNSYFLQCHFHICLHKYLIVMNIFSFDFKKQIRIRCGHVKTSFLLKKNQQKPGLKLCTKKKPKKNISDLKGLFEIKSNLHS